MADKTTIKSIPREINYENRVFVSNAHYDSLFHATTDHDGSYYYYYYNYYNDRVCILTLQVYMRAHIHTYNCTYRFRATGACSEIYYFLRLILWEKKTIKTLQTSLLFKFFLNSSTRSRLKRTRVFNVIIESNTHTHTSI